MNSVHLYHLSHPPYHQQKPALCFSLKPQRPPVSAYTDPAHLSLGSSQQLLQFTQSLICLSSFHIHRKKSIPNIWMLTCYVVLFSVSQHKIIKYLLTAIGKGDTSVPLPRSDAHTQWGIHRVPITFSALCQAQKIVVNRMDSHGAYSGARSCTLNNIHD